MPNYPDFVEILLKNYSNYIVRYQYIQSATGRIQKIRFELINKALVDIYYSKSSGKYSFHYETETEYYRHDNSPHHPDIKTFPKHSHYQNVVGESNLSENILQAVLDFFKIIKERFI